MKFVMLYGPPGVGKLTVARELATLTGFKLFDNHASIDFVRRVFEFKDAPFWPLTFRMRIDMYEAAAEHGVDIVTTVAYSYPTDTGLMERMFEAVEKHGGTVLLVHLTCAMEQLEERVQHESRTNKIHSLEMARPHYAENDFFTPMPDRASLSIDNTLIEPDVAARMIAAHYRLSKDVEG